MKKKTGVLVPLSPQNLVDCSTRDGNLGCRGGYISRSYSYVIRNGGVDSESFYPYEHQVLLAFASPTPRPPRPRHLRNYFSTFCRMGSAGIPLRGRRASAPASTSSRGEMRRR